MLQYHRIILFGLLLISSVYGDTYTIEQSMTTLNSGIVNSNNISFQFTGAVHQNLYEFENGTLGILSIREVSAPPVLKDKIPPTVKVYEIVENTCGLKVYAEKMKIWDNEITVIALDKNDKIVNTTLHGSKLYTFTNQTIKSKIPLILSDDIKLSAYVDRCMTTIKIPIDKKQLWLSWGTIISLLGIMIFIIFKRLQR